MVKIFNWFFGSFFRTLGRVIVFIVLGYILFSFININDFNLPNLFGLINVSADEISINNNDSISYRNTKDWFYFDQGNIRLRFWGGNGYDITNVPKYFLITMCTDMPKVSSWYNNSNNTGEMELSVYKTDIPCNFTTSNYSGKIMYFYGTGFSCNVQGSDCSPYGDFTYYQGGNSSSQLLSYGFSTDKIDIDFSSGAVITQNQQIINQNQQIINQSQQTNDKLNDINGSLNNSDTTGATNDANNFFNNFSTDTHGLTGIITSPLNAINSLTSKTCTPLVLPLPFVDKELTLPCMREIYTQHFAAFMSLYDTITLGIVSYWVCVRIFSFVKDFKNPEHDEVEVVDL